MTGYVLSPYGSRAEWTAYTLFTYERGVQYRSYDRAYCRPNAKFNIEITHK